MRHKPGLQPKRVFEIAHSLLVTKSTNIVPPWYKAMSITPPGDCLTRPLPIAHNPPKKYPRHVRKPSKMFQPQPLTYEEDRLRKRFFRDHPWELARPKLVVEHGGCDGNFTDWSTLEQPRMALSGERCEIPPWRGGFACGKLTG